MTSTGTHAAVEKMRAEGLGDAAVESFARQVDRLRAGESGVLPESEIRPATGVPDADALPDADPRDALAQAVVIKLNGGLGTSMGMTKAKSLLEVKDGLTFLDVIARQVLDLRARSGAHVPLVLMNSFATREDSLAALERHAGIAVDGLPLDFVQNKVPKLDAATYEPVAWPADPTLEWAPPGHGDLYVALQTSGMLDALLGAGYRWAFVSNADNLGATLDTRILAWLAAGEIPFLMEVADRTEADRKGGHLAARPDGSLVLREVAQCPDEDLDAFQDITRHRFFNTNTLWLDLRAIADAAAGGLDLPMIVNRKTVDPTDKGSTPVIQLETAMGAAVGVIDGARAIRVPRTRFAPVKTTNDLLALRSDAYVVDDASRVALDPRRGGTPVVVDLDPAHFKLVGDFEPRFPGGAPSLVGADRLVVRGDVVFEPGVTVRGSVVVEGVDRVTSGTVLEG